MSASSCRRIGIFVLQMTKHNWNKLVYKQKAKAFKIKGYLAVKRFRPYLCSEKLYITVIRAFFALTLWIFTVYLSLR